MTKIDRSALRDKAHITLEREPADTSYTRAGLDASACEWIKNELAAGNPWAWCDVKVTAFLHGLDGSAYLGQCSYESKHAFMACDYYSMLVDEAVDELAKAIEAIAADHGLWEHDRVVCLLCASTSG